MTIVDICGKITKCNFFTDDNEFLKDIFTAIAENFLKQEEAEEHLIQKEKKYELMKKNN